MGTKMFFCAIILAAFFSNSTAQEVLPFEEKAKYEKFMAQKADDILVKLLGPNQAKVIVETVMDFSRTEKVEYEKEPDKSRTPFSMKDEAGTLSAADYLMPGFEALSPLKTDSPKSYIKQMIFPSGFIKKIKVTVLVNRNLDDDSVRSVRDVVSEALSVNPSRGDEILVIKAVFAPLWKTVWYNPESMNFIVKYIIMSILGIISLIIVAIGFLKLAGAMNTMAKVQQSHQINMELSTSGTGAGGAGTMLSAPGVVMGAGPAPQKGERAEEEDDKIYFNVKPHQIDALVDLMVKEEPLNVSIVVSHLKKEIKDEFIKKLPAAFSAEVIAGLSRIRFIENDTIAILKDELETRLSGAVGGVETALEALENLPPMKKMSIIKSIEKMHPQTAMEIRKRILLFDDLMFLEKRELSLLCSSTEIADWANLYPRMQAEFCEKLKEELSDTAWKIIVETNKYERASDEKAEESVERIIKKAENLIYEGRIKKPEAKISSNLIENEKSERTGAFLTRPPEAKYG